MIPKHVGVIIDGNRRFAKQLMKKPWEGHFYGLEKSREFLEWACQNDIKHLTAYTLSLENMKSRPKRELAFILKCLKDEMNAVLKEKTHPSHRYGIRIRFIGRRNVLPDDVQRLMSAVEKATSGYSKHVLNLAVAYGGQQEIVDAIKEIAAKCMKGILSPAQLDEALVKEHLYTNGSPYPDMIIRSGGEKRLSNFLPFQSAYSELVFTDKKWPELTKEDFKGFLREFEQRQRRFGK